jgi:glyoxylase-like metal-dependent hydrolase (beta-lactamase superfamily II)
VPRLCPSIRPLLLAAACAAVGALAVPAAAQRDWSAVEVRTTQVTRDLYMLEGAGGNIGLAVGADAVLMIDDQFEPLAPKIKQAIAAITDKPVKFLLNTHFHGDHVGGNAAFARDGVVIVAHDNVRRRMSVEQWNALFDRTTPAYPGLALPALTFNDSVTFHLDGQTITCFHVANAHTDGDVVVWFREADVVHMGDLLFNGRYPVIDLSAGGGIDGMIAGADRVLAAIGPGTRLIAGHGPLATRDDLKAYRDMLVESRARVAKLLKEKRTLEQIQEARPLADLDVKWGGGSVKQELFLQEIVWSLDRSRIPAQP